VARELTKTYEEVIRGEIAAVLEGLEKRKIRGEITVVVAGRGRGG
jgi:16S rRNA (cytidine1402-2'-O)-methyltransferase